MSKFGKVSMIMALVAMMATPALAEFSLSGYYRLQGYSTDYTGNEDTSSFIDQRLRMKFTNTLNDYVAVVYYGEVDAPFGKAGSTPKGSTETGGTLSADGVNVETKNMYVDFKIPNTTWAVRTGLQGWGTGNDYESLVVDDDMAAINARGEFGPVVLDLVYSKWYENDDEQWDDADFYGAKASFKASEQLNLGAIAMFQDVNINDGDDSYYTASLVSDSAWFGGVNGDFRFGTFGIKSFFLYGDADSDAPGIDGSSWVFDVAGFAKLGNGNMKLHLAYIPDDEEAAIFNPTGGFEFHNDNLMIFMSDIFYNNGPQGAIAFDQAAWEGYGLWFATVSGDMALPQDSYFKYGAGYFSAVEDDLAGVGNDREGTSLGIEAAAMVGKKFAEVYDLSLRGSYAILGDFFDGRDLAGDLTPGQDPDDLWQVVAMLNVAF